MADGNNRIGITTGDSQTFTCLTDSCRPAARIQWYIGRQNVTDQATTEIALDGTKFISSSALSYTGKETDHHKMIHCEAFNIEGRAQVNSVNMMLNINGKPKYIKSRTIYRLICYCRYSNYYLCLNLLHFGMQLLNGFNSALFCVHLGILRHLIRFRSIIII